MCYHSLSLAIRNIKKNKKRERRACPWKQTKLKVKIHYKVFLICWNTKRNVLPIPTRIAFLKTIFKTTKYNIALASLQELNFMLLMVTTGGEKRIRVTKEQRKLPTYGLRGGELLLLLLLLLLPLKGLQINQLSSVKENKNTIA